MKLLTTTAIAAAAVASAKSAQTYSTSVYTECTDIPDATITSYNTETVTYCSECEGGMTAPPGGYVHTTIWTTKMLNFCPTGLTEATVTITESCTNATPTWSPGHPDYVPQGYTTSLMTCTVCGESPLTRVMTYPVGSPPAYPLAVANTPIAAPTEGPGICQGLECKAPYPTAAPAPAPAPVAGPQGPAAPMSTPVSCNGGSCAIPASSPGSMSAPGGNASNIAPYSVAAPAVFAQSASLFALLVGAVVTFIII